MVERTAYPNSRRLFQAILEVTTCHAGTEPGPVDPDTVVIEQALHRAAVLEEIGEPEKALLDYQMLANEGHANAGRDVVFSDVPSSVSEVLSGRTVNERHIGLLCRMGRKTEAFELYVRRNHQEDLITAFARSHSLAQDWRWKMVSAEILEGYSHLTAESCVIDD